MSAEKTKLHKVLDATYAAGLGMSLAAIVDDLTLQELVRERVANGSMHLEGIFRFIQDNFVGDVGNAFAYVFGIPFLGEVINLEIQNSETIQKKVKEISAQVSLVLPFVMAIFFILAATDGETAQRVFKWGTPEAADLTGAYFGTAVALVSVLKARNKIYPRTPTSPEKTERE